MITEPYDFITTEFSRVLEPHIPKDRRLQALVAFFTVIDGYDEPHRVYHDINHLAGVLHELAQPRWGRKLTEQQYLTAFVALLLHDYVYRVPAGDISNEALSAKAADWFLEEAGLKNVVRVWDVKQAIYATEGHHVHDIVDLAVCWSDLWQLAGSKKVVERNSRRIREEYMKVYTEEQYAAGRRKFLESYRSPFRLHPEASLGLRIRAKWLNWVANRHIDRERAQL